VSLDKLRQLKRVGLKSLTEVLTQIYYCSTVVLDHCNVLPKTCTLKLMCYEVHLFNQDFMIH
jgi:hypothetical protein